MREIKFRGKTLAHFPDDDGSIVIPKGQWIKGGIVFDEDRVWIDTPYYGQIIVDKNTIGQFTGLKDENGKEIYEGDIVYIASEDENFEIEWFEECARFCITGNGVTCDFDNFNGKDLEVIGNIYEN